MFGSFCVLMTMFAYFLIPETKGLSLERMDELFGASKVSPAKLITKSRSDSVLEIHAEKV